MFNIVRIPCDSSDGQPASPCQKLMCYNQSDSLEGISHFKPKFLDKPSQHFEPDAVSRVCIKPLMIFYQLSQQYGTDFEKPSTTFQWQEGSS